MLATLSPGTLDLATARYVLKESARDAGPVGWDADYGYGILDAVDALGVFRLIQEGAVTVSQSNVRSLMNTSIRMSEPDQPPEGTTVANTLIVEFKTAVDARVVEAAGISDLRGIRPGVAGRSRLVYLKEGTDLSHERDRLLERPDVDAVYYNYRYQPLAEPTRSR